jgi:hypothetical protein
MDCNFTEKNDKLKMQENIMRGTTFSVVTRTLYTACRCLHVLNKLVRASSISANAADLLRILVSVFYTWPFRGFYRSPKLYWPGPDQEKYNNEPAVNQILG